VELYNTTRSWFVGSIPLSLAGGLATYMAQSSLQEFESVLAPITALVKALGQVVTASLEALEVSSEKIGLDILLRYVGEGIDWSSQNILMPFIRLFANQAVLISSGASGMSAVGYTSYVLVTKDAQEVMSISKVNQLFGHDEEIRQSIDALVEDLARLVSIDPEKQAKLKNLIGDEVIRQAQENDYSTKESDYDIDVVKIMTDNNIVDPGVALVLANAEKLYEISSQSPSAAAQSPVTMDLLVQNVDKVAALSVVLQKAIESGEIKNKDLEQDILALVGSVESKLKLAGYMLEEQQ
ncbi:MAG: hypothetical protein AAF202_13375, partial [Pseudomonadota bacterium]